MEAILPFKIKNEQKYFQSALKLGFDEMEIYKFIYVMQQSDLDVFQKMHDERINVLIYCWELCEDYKHKISPDEWELPEELEMILKLLVPWSLDIWFSKEWEKCKSYLRQGLIHCFNRARDLMMRVPDMMQINWDFLLLYNLTPWNVPYLKNLTVTKEKTLETGAQSIETVEQQANADDLAYLKLEQLPLIVLRLIKLFDQCSIDMVKTLCMRVIAAWNKVYQIELQTTRRPPYIPPEDKRCLLMICHIYLMAVYESDDVKGYVIDNLIYNIRFYFQGFQNSTALYAMDNLEYTPARFIALTTIHLRLKKSELFDFFIWNSYDTSLVNLFGVVAQAYKSYLLGNLLMELNNMNEDDFAANVPLYKRLMNSYVNEREKSELFLLNELEKLELQRYALNIRMSTSFTDFKSKICKGNRMSNIGNYENSDDVIAPAIDEGVKDVKVKEEMPSIKEDPEGEAETEEIVKEKESDLRLDPIFQNIPNNENILYYVYEVLAKKDYKGWHFAKIVLLVKIIGHELNMIETWRYHPGLTTDFMLNLETKLSTHYADLAKIFKDHAFIEQEFWLTAFYLNPMPDTYETIKRLGMRNNRKRTDEHTKLVMSIDNIDAKYGLLSSTIDVKEIANLANTEEPDGDYDPLFSALKSLHLPDSLIKDMLTAIFLPRNRNFAWIIDWTELRTRCKILLQNSKEKKRFVELNMAEANERLKFLNIDYEKYKNRPQLDYGTIEAGYENLMNREDYDRSDDDEDEEDEEDFEDDEEDVYESKRSSSRRGAAETKKEDKIEDDNSQEDPFLTGKRRTRARVAATVASYLFQSIPRATRRKRNENNELVAKDDAKTKADKEDDDEDIDEKSNDSKSSSTTTNSVAPSAFTDDSKEDPDIIKKNIKECLYERPSFSNSTPNFRPLIDIWNIEKSHIQSIDNNCVSLLESSSVLSRMAKLKSLNKQTNPLGCNEHEAIDDTEMLIINTDFPLAKFTSREKAPEIRNFNFNTEPKTIKEDNVSSITETIVIEDDIITLSESAGSTKDNDFVMISDTDTTDRIENDEIDAEDVVKIIDDSIGAVETYEDKDCEMLIDYISEELGLTKEIDTTHAKEVDESVADSVPKEFSVDEVPEETSDEVNKTKKAPSNDDNSNESIKSDMPTSALKNSENVSAAVSESNFGINSKRNSENTSSNEMEDNAENIIEEIFKDTSKETREHINKEEHTIKEGNMEEKNEKEHQNEEDKEEKMPAILRSSDKLQEDEKNKSQENSNEPVTEILKETTDKDKEIIEFCGEPNKNDQNMEKSKEITKESEDIETEDTQTDLVTKDCGDPDKETAKESENIESELLQKDIKKADTETIVQTEQEKSDLLTKDSENTETKMEKEESELLTKDSDNADTNISKESESKSEIAKDTNSEIKNVDIEKTKESEATESEAIKSDLPTKEIKNTNSDVTTTVSMDSKVTEDSKKSESELITSHSMSDDKTTEFKNTDSELIAKDSKQDNDDEITKEPNSSELSDGKINKSENSELLAKIKESTKDIMTEIEKTQSCLEDNLKLEENKTDLDQSQQESSKLEDTLMESLKVEEEDDEESENEELKQLIERCLKKRVRVLVRTLRPSDVMNLRQPKIKVKRINMEQPVVESEAKRTKRCPVRKVYSLDESSNNSTAGHSSSSDAYRPPETKRRTQPKRQPRRQPRASESENDSVNSEDINLFKMSSARYIRERRLSATQQASSSSSSSTMRSTRRHRTTSVDQETASKLIVTPRSASGLKLRISNQSDHPVARKRRRTSVEVDDVIQLSSSSEASVQSIALNPIDEVIEIDEIDDDVDDDADDDHPLFEEEILL